jgi:hypothetical protein
MSEEFLGKALVVEACKTLRINWRIIVITDQTISSLIWTLAVLDKCLHAICHFRLTSLRYLSMSSKSLLLERLISKTFNNFISWTRQVTLFKLHSSVGTFTQKSSPESLRMTQSLQRWLRILTLS